MPLPPRPRIPSRGHAPTLTVAARDLATYIRRQDWDAFSYTAWWFGVHIIVRRSNAETLKFIGKPGFTPKGPQTKAKTAQCSVNQAKNGRPSDVAGLVCNPFLVGPDAYDPRSKYDSAVKEWTKFVQTGRLATDLELDSSGVPTRAYLPEGKLFYVDTRPESPRYGALMKSRYGATNPKACDYVHGDYDLFAIIPKDNPSQNIVVAEQHLSSPWHSLNIERSGGGTDPERKAVEEIHNFRGKEFMDVQNMLNRRIGAPMILHGSQEKAVSFFEKDGVDVFLANGEHSFALTTAGDLQRFYQVNLGGRKLHNFMAGKSQGERVAEEGTLWQSVGTKGPGGSLALDDIIGAKFGPITG